MIDFTLVSIRLRNELNKLPWSDPTGYSPLRRILRDDLSVVQEPQRGRQIQRFE
jgi:hypothetical protein